MAAHLRASRDNVNVISRVHNKLGDDDDDGYDVVLASKKSFSNICLFRCGYMTSHAWLQPLDLSYFWEASSPC